MPAKPAPRFLRGRSGYTPASRPSAARRQVPSTRQFAVRRPFPARAGAWLLRNRRLAVALLLCLAAGIAVHQLTPASEHKIQVLVAARERAVEAGGSLTIEGVQGALERVLTVTGLLDLFS